MAARNTQADTCDYKVTVHTSDIKFAGTDANVSINIFGSAGNTGEQSLSNSKNNFERGKVDVFSLKGLANVGGLTHVVIGHDNSMLGAGWHLNQVWQKLFPAPRVWFITNVMEWLAFSNALMFAASDLLHIQHAASRW